MIVGEPRIKGKDLRLERQKEFVERPAEISEADKANAAACEQLRICIAVKAVAFPACHKVCVSCVNTARKRESHTKPHFRNGQSKDGCGRQNMNAPAKATDVVDIGQKVGFDIDDRP